MKRLVMTTLMVVLFAFISINAQISGQSTTTDNSKYIITITGVIDTAGGTNDSLEVRLNFEDYDQSGTYFAYNYVFTASTGAPNVCVDLYGLTNSVWHLIEQVVDTSVSESWVSTASNLSNQRAEDYKLIFEQVDAAGANFQVTSFTFQWYSPQKDAVKP